MAAGCARRSASGSLARAAGDGGAGAHGAIAPARAASATPRRCAIARPIPQRNSASLSVMSLRHPIDGGHARTINEVRAGAAAAAAAVVVVVEPRSTILRSFVPSICRSADPPIRRSADPPIRRFDDSTI
ncbi:hypothetical protein WT60_14225 [Burkholderia sp. MSMB617WGS]|nr:hypothetical protein WT60_14225 [Burkholderia sp. MSMB617WGS]